MLRRDLHEETVIPSKPNRLLHAWLPHACRVGTARRYLAGMAALSRRLAGKVRADSVGLCRDHPQPGAARAGGTDRQRCGCGGQARKMLDKADALSNKSVFTVGRPTVSGCVIPAASFLRHQPSMRAEAGACPHTVSAKKKDQPPRHSSPPSSALTRGPNIPITVTTKKSEA